MKVNWTQPTTMANGDPFTAAMFAGWELSIDDKPAIAVPLVWDGKPDTVYSFDLEALSLTEAVHKLTMRTIEKDGDKSAPSPNLSFTYRKVPSAPLVQSVA